MDSAKKKGPLTIVLVLAVITAIVLWVVLSKKPAHREQQEYEYYIYGIAADGTIYKWEGHGQHWPVTYKGKELLPLYVCRDPSHGKPYLFGGVPVGITSTCPECGSRSVGLYTERKDGPIDATRIKNPSE